MVKLRPAVANSDSACIQFGFSFDSLIVTFWGGEDAARLQTLVLMRPMPESCRCQAFIPAIYLAEMGTLLEIWELTTAEGLSIAGNKQRAFI